MTLRTSSRESESSLIINSKTTIKEITNGRAEIVIKESEEIITNGVETGGTIKVAIGTTTIRMTLKTLIMGRNPQKRGTIQISSLTKIKINRSKMELMKGENTTTSMRWKKISLTIKDLTIRETTNAEAATVKRRSSIKTLFQRNHKILRTALLNTKKRPITTRMKPLRHSIE